MNEACCIQQDIIEREKTKNERSERELQSQYFVLACRHYNRALACARFILKLINEELSFHSLSQFVKKIPDEAVDEKLDDLNVSNRALIFLQKATLACFNRIAKRQFFLHFCKKHPMLRKKLSKAYETMINSFNTCQECLNNQRFTVIYDEIAHEIQAVDGDVKPRMANRAMNLKRISYFSDFVLMQQLMTIEIDILVGRTNNYMRYLDLNFRDAEKAVDRNMPSKATESMHQSF